MKKTRILCAAALAAAISLGGCSVRFNTNQKIADDYIVARPSAEEYKNDKTLEINYLTFKKEYLFWLKNNGITDDSDESCAEECTNQRSNIISYLINEAIVRDKADELGVKLTEDDFAQIEESFNSYVDEQIEYYGKIADFSDLGTSEAITDEMRAERGSEAFDSYLAECLLTRDDLLMWQLSEALTQKLIEEVTKDVTIDRSVAEERYNDFIENTVKAAYKSNPSDYEKNSYDNFWLPEGTRRAKHILLMMEDATVDEIARLRSEGDDEAADKLREEALAANEQNIIGIKNMLDNGGDFTELINEYSDDAAGSQAYPDGYTITPESTSYVAGFKEALYELEEIGEYTIIATDLGWHIIMYAGNAEISEDTTNQYIDYILSEAVSSAVDAKFSQKLTEWNEEYSYEIDTEALKIQSADDTSK
ncbi:MAG: peptidylprolyl isomerase [Oscillospiraceae bacterium]